MSSPTSTASLTRTWQQTNIFSFPIPTLIPASFVNLEPRTTLAPSCCDPNFVVVELSTTLIIPNYEQVYPSIPIQSFQPQYNALADASLVTSAYLQDLYDANTSLLVTGMLTMLFIRNLFTSGGYIWRGKVKNKTLFYLLFVSQLLAPVSLIPIILSYFQQSFPCTFVIVVSCVSASTSLAILITGILGIKVYRCLNNSRFVLFALILFQLGSTAMVIMDALATTGERRLSGSCVRTSNLQLTRIYVTIQLAESSFICLGFMYACWKSSTSPSVRGRISIHLSMDDLPINLESDPPSVGNVTSRGWWDYVPENEKPVAHHSSTTKKRKTISNIFKGLMGNKKHSVNKSWKKGASKISDENKSRGLKITSVLQSATVRISNRSPQGITLPVNDTHRNGRSSPVPSSFSRLSKLIPRMNVLRAVLRDELLYTTFITASCVIIATLAIVGLNVNNGLAVTGWIALNWGIISILAIHSFGRVVHRHEKEAWLRHPATCDLRAGAGYAEPHSQRPQRLSDLEFDDIPRSTPSSIRAPEQENPFSDNHRQGPAQRKKSWGSDVSLPPVLGPGEVNWDISLGHKQDDTVNLPRSVGEESSFSISGLANRINSDQYQNALKGMVLTDLAESWIEDDKRYMFSDVGRQRHDSDSSNAPGTPVPM